MDLLESTHFPAHPSLTRARTHARAEENAHVCTLFLLALHSKLNAPSFPLLFVSILSIDFLVPKVIAMHKPRQKE
jgi:hypothetical protein